MEAELTALATSGATTVVGLMASDAWAQVRGRLARFFARGGEAGAVDAELEQSRQELTAARAADDDLAAGDVEAEWRTRLRRTLGADPAAAEELRRLLAELDPAGAAGQAPTSVVHNTFSGGVNHGVVMQGRDFRFGAMTFHASGAVPPEAAEGTEPGGEPPAGEEPDR
ncbi:hypothetical protein [Actinacidiphila paucisporea]|uniref:Uncharacterized protein n=1 Tax=Actinacidiphila paucisporea TaxID=310782 RepID=A0A1M7ETS8_9ACTN|nr:hypothetical protein [Actinacidiphila paucisporea]SHL95164.1 hypothetical protein SAMN05216499_10784 [Actinacidiphila paucisporea]